jgi:hypothetical protein
MSYRIDRRTYADTYGPTMGDRVLAFRLRERSPVSVFFRPRQGQN